MKKTNTTATASARDIITPMYYRYHRFAHACGAVDAELRAIMAGDRTGTIRLRRLMATRDAAFDALDKYLRHTAAAIKIGDTDMQKRLAHKAANIRAAGVRPLITLEDE